VAAPGVYGAPLRKATFKLFTHPIFELIVQVVKLEIKDVLAISEETLIEFEKELLSLKIVNSLCHELHLWLQPNKCSITLRLLLRTIVLIRLN
jgi:hypothetical protein